MIRIPLGHSDAAERAQFLKLLVRLGGPGFLLLAVGEYRALDTGMISLGWFGVLFASNLPFLLLVSGVLFDIIDRTATGFTNTVLGIGHLPPEPAHSACESLAARGFYPEAVQAFREWITDHPDDNLARIKLAELHRLHLGDPEEAERLYREVRDRRPQPGHEFLASNLLIELYRATGRTDRLMVELAKFADRQRGTRAGREAGRLLAEMKEEMRRREQP